jgi:hypothetical protein
MLRGWEDFVAANPELKPWEIRIARDLLGIFKRFPGKDNCRSGKVITEYYLAGDPKRNIPKFPKLNRVRTRRIIAALRKSGLVMVIADSKGYYGAVDDADAWRWCVSMRQRQKAIERAVEPIEVALKAKYRGQQTSLEIKAGTLRGD